VLKRLRLWLNTHTDQVIIVVSLGSESGWWRQRVPAGHVRAHRGRMSTVESWFAFRSQSLGSSFMESRDRLALERSSLMERQLG